MESNLEILLLQFEQPNESIWNEILRFAESWNETKENKFINESPFELAIYFPEIEDKELKELEEILEQKHNEQHWVWLKTIPHDPSKELIESCDFIQIIGNGYPDNFFLNESQALEAMKPCEKCGTIHSHLRLQKGPLEVNEAFLSKKGYPNNAYSPPGLDIINLPHGALLVSKKVVELIKENGFHGAIFLNVINQHGKISEKLFQLVTDIIILLPDNLREGTICPGCGTVLSTLTGEFLIRKERIKGVSVFSRNPSGASAIYISNPLYHLLKSNNIRGLTPAQCAKVMDE